MQIYNHNCFILNNVFLFKYSSINQNVKKESSGGAISIATMMAFQEFGDGVVEAEQNI